MDAINSTASYNSVFGDYILACKNLVNSFIHFVKRKTNTLAHEIARNSIHYGKDQVTHTYTFTKCTFLSFKKKNRYIKISKLPFSIYLPVKY